MTDNKMFSQKLLGGQQQGNAIGDPHQGVLSVTVDQITMNMVRAGLIDLHVLSKSPFWHKRLVGRDYNLIRLSNGSKLNCRYAICEYEGYRVSEWNHVVKQGLYRRLVNTGDYIIKIGSVITEGIRS